MAKCFSPSLRSYTPGTFISQKRKLDAQMLCYLYLKYTHWSQRDTFMYNKVVLNLIRFDIELLSYFLKDKKGVALKGKNGINLGEISIFEQPLGQVKSL